MNTRKHVFATAAMALIAALAGGSAFGIAGSDHSANAQRDSTDQATYPSSQAMGSSHQSAAPSGAISSPGESSEQSSQTYGSSDNTEPNDANAPADDDSSATQQSMTQQSMSPSDQESMTTPDQESTEAAPGASEDPQSDSDMRRMVGPVTDSVQRSGFTKVHLTTTDEEPSHTTMGPAIDTADSATVEGSSMAPVPSTTTATNGRVVVAEPAIVTPTEPDEPLYTPETGDAQYGSKLEPERSMPPAAVEPPSRFNDATGQ
jgi:hypothetical protein